MEILKNKDVVQNFLALQYEGKIEEAFANYADPNFEWIVSSGNNPKLENAIPWAGMTHKGLEGYKNLTGLLFGEYEALAFDAKEFYEIGNKVFMIGHFKFKHYKTQKIADSDFVGLFNMKNGKIAGRQFYENTFAVAEGRRQ